LGFGVSEFRGGGGGWKKAGTRVQVRVASYEGWLRSVILAVKVGRRWKLWACVEEQIEPCFALHVFAGTPSTDSIVDNPFFFP